MCARELYPFEEQFKAMPIEGKLLHLFERIHFLERELNVASRRADVLLGHSHDHAGHVVVSVHQVGDRR